MRRPRIFTGQPLASGVEIALEPGAARHLVSVLRLGAGDGITLFNGQGGEYSATIQSGSARQTIVSVNSFSAIDRESPLAIHLGVAVSKGDRFDWVIQKVTELGVTTITPLVTERTEVRLNQERRDKKYRRWCQVAISACEQSGRNRPPGISPPVPCGDWLSVQAEAKFVLHPAGAKRLQGLDDSCPKSVALLVGPEGGLSDTEVIAAQQCGFATLALGPRILRTETAPLAGISILQALWGDML